MRTVYQRLTEEGLTPDARIRELERELAEAHKAIRLLFRLVDALEKRAGAAMWREPAYLAKLRERAKVLRERMG